MFRKFFPQLNAAAAQDDLHARVATLELNNSGDSPQHSIDDQYDYPDDVEEQQPTVEEERKQAADAERDELLDARREGVSQGMENAGHGVPVDPDDPEAYGDECYDPSEEDWSTVQEIEPIVDPTFCFECLYTQSPDEQEANDFYALLKKARSECLGHKRPTQICVSLQQEYNKYIRPHLENVKHRDLPVSLINWRDHPTIHVKQPDVIEEKSLAYICNVMSHLERTTFRRPKKRKHPENDSESWLDTTKINLWLKLEVPRKRMMIEQRRRLKNELI